MQKYLNNVQDTFGNAIGSVTVTVRDNPGGGVSTIFSDNASTPKDNPFTNDADGEFFFYGTNARYDIELTGPITETISDIRLLDVVASGTTLRVNTNIVTATPPTSEAVGGSFQIWDLDNTDQLALIGYTTSNLLQFSNWMRGGLVQLASRNAVGVKKSIIVGDPDGDSSMHYAGIERIVAGDAGVCAIRSDGNTDTESRQLIFEHQNGVTRAIVGHISNDLLRMRNSIIGGQIRLEHTKTGPVVQTVLLGVPGGATYLYYDGIGKVGSASTGIRVFGDITTSTPPTTEAISARVNFMDSDETDLIGEFGYIGSNILRLRNKMHSGLVHISGEDSSGAERIFLIGDPDATTIVRADTNLELQVNNGETALLATANGAVGLYFNNILEFETSFPTAANIMTGARVRSAAGAMQPVGLGVIINDATAWGSGTITPFQLVNAHESILHDEASATTMNTYASTGGDQTNIPDGAQWEVKNDGAGALTIGNGTGVTLYWWAGLGVTPATGIRTLARGSIATVRKISDTRYEIWGNGLS